EQHRRTRFGDAPDELAHLAHLARVEAVGGLVEHEDLGLAQQHPSEAEALAHALGVGLDPAVDGGAEVGDGERGLEVGVGPAPAGRRPRDAQRTRVYLAETPLPSSPLPGLDACARFADRVVGTLWWHERFPERDLGHVPRMRPGNGARQAFYREEATGPTIT